MALVTVEDVLSYLGTDAEQDAFWIYCSDATATVGTVQVAGNVLTLTHTSALLVTTTDTFILTDVANATIGLLVAAINDLIAGVWQAGIYCHSLSVSTDLLEIGVLNALLVANEQVLRITGDYLITQLIARATDFLNRICGRNLESAEYTHERYDGGEGKVFLEKWPVSAVAQVCSGKLDVIRVKYTSSTARNAYVSVTTTGVTLMVDGEDVGALVVADLTFETNATLLAMATAINGVAGWTATVVATAYNSYPSLQIFRKLNRFALNQDIDLEIPDEPLDGYEIDYDNGILYFPSAFSSGWRNIFVSYTGGYVDTPDSLEQICIELVKYKYEKRDTDSALKSESIGKVYSYTLQDLKNALPPDLMAELELFKSRDF